MAPKLKEESSTHAANEGLPASPLLDLVKTGQEDAEGSPVVPSTNTPLDLPLNAPSAPYGDSTRHQWVGMNFLSSYTLTD